MTATTPKVPVMVFVKKSVAKIAARINLIDLSAMPMFFFIVFVLMIEQSYNDKKACIVMYVTEEKFYFWRGK